MRVVGSPRRSLRRAPDAPAHVAPDLRRTVRAALRTGASRSTRHFRTPATRHRRLVLLLDVSGSMEPYARALLRFVHAAVVGRTQVEAFALGTRLTRVTRELVHARSRRGARHARPSASSTGRAAPGSATGCAAFNDEWGVARHGPRRGRRHPLRRLGPRRARRRWPSRWQRLHRVAHRVVWVNPLKVSPGYAPLARGMAAALPYVDRFVEGHSLDALERLADIAGRA